MTPVSSDRREASNIILMWYLAHVFSSCCLFFGNTAKIFENAMNALGSKGNMHSAILDAKNISKHYILCWVSLTQYHFTNLY